MDVVGITQRCIAQMNAQELLTVRNELVAKRMTMDKKFSIFLDQTKLPEEEIDCPEWNQYHVMLKQYDHINTLYRACQYWLERYAV